MTPNIFGVRCFGNLFPKRTPSPRSIKGCASCPTLSPRSQKRRKRSVFGVSGTFSVFRELVPETDSLTSKHQRLRVTPNPFATLTETPKTFRLRSSSSVFRELVPETDSLTSKHQRLRVTPNPFATLTETPKTFRLRSSSLPLYRCSSILRCHISRTCRLFLPGMALSVFRELVPETDSLTSKHQRLRVMPNPFATLTETPKTFRLRSSSLPLYRCSSILRCHISRTCRLFLPGMALVRFGNAENVQVTQ